MIAPIENLHSHTKGGESMLKQVLFLSVLISLSACASGYKVQRLQPTKETVYGNIEVRTKQGRIYHLTSCRATATHLIGVQKNGQRFEAPFKSIDRIVNISKESDAESAFATSILLLIGGAFIIKRAVI